MLSTWLGHVDPKSAKAMATSLRLAHRSEHRPRLAVGPAIGGAAVANCGGVVMTGLRRAAEDSTAFGELS